MSSNAICYKNGVKLKTINGVSYLGATPPEEATPPDIFSFDQRTKNPRSAPDVTSNVTGNVTGNVTDQMAANVSMITLWG